MILFDRHCAVVGATERVVWQGVGVWQGHAESMQHFSSAICMYAGSREPGSEIREAGAKNIILVCVLLTGAKCGNVCATSVSALMVITSFSGAGQSTFLWPGSCDPGLGPAKQELEPAVAVIPVPCPFFFFFVCVCLASTFVISGPLSQCLWPVNFFLTAALGVLLLGLAPPENRTQTGLWPGLGEYLSSVANKKRLKGGYKAFGKGVNKCLTCRRLDDQRVYQRAH